MADEKLAFKKSSLSATALEYYTRYGQNRDLEKYLRVQHRSASKSSSEGSLVNAGERIAAESSKKVGKSLDDLSSRTSKPDNKSEQSKDKSNTKCTSADEAGSGDIKIKKSAAQRINKKTKTKSYSFNSESNVEIIFPPEFILAKYQGKEGVDAFVPVNQQNMHNPTEKMLSDSANQTDDGLAAVNANDLVEPAAASTAVDKELVPLPETPRRDTEPPPNAPIVDVSPTSSIASNKMRLEWDSLADIGYKLVDMNSESNLSTYERSALVKFFAERGLTFDDKLVIFATPDKSKASIPPIAEVSRPKQKLSIKDKWKKATEQHLPNVKGVSPTTSKRLWEKALDKYKQKYGKSKSSSDSKEQSMHTLSLIRPQSQSTPISFMDADNSNAAAKQTRDASHNTTFHEDNRDMASQTSHVSTEAKGIQVQGEEGGMPINILYHKYLNLKYLIDVSGIFLNFRDCESETSTQTSPSSNGREAASVASFEFCSPGEYLKQQRPKDGRETLTNEPIKEAEEDEKVPPLQARLANLEISSENSKEISGIEEQNDENDQEKSLPENDKENISPEDQQDTIFPENDKENIPPLPFPLPKLNDVEDSPPPKQITGPPVPKRFAAIEKSLSNDSVLPDDLQKAVEMLNVLVSKRRIDVETKKKLMRRVVKRLLKAKYGNESGSQGDSTASMSRNSSESSKNDQRSLQTSKDVSKAASDISISGIHALSLSATSASVPPDSKNAPDENQPEPLAEKTALSHSNHRWEPAVTSLEQDKEDTMKDWLAPMTYSEIQFMNQKMLNEKENEIREEQQRKQDNLQPKLKPQPNPAMERGRIFEQEKMRHLNWIDNEIERLNNLKVMMSEAEGGADGSSVAQRGNPLENRRVQSQDVLYTNAAKETIGSTSTSSQSMNLPNSSSSSSMSTLSNRAPNAGLPNTPDSFTRVTELSEWNSHMNMQLIVKTRNKLETPPSCDDSIQAYAKAKRDQFLNKYSRAHGNARSDGVPLNEYGLRQQPIYTKPYSTDHYCEPRRTHIKTLSKQMLNVDAYTSITGSNGFLSSNSISIAVAGNTSSNTTTHQYDNRASIGVQTSDTLMRTKPILESKCGGWNKPTLRVSRLMNNKQQQARPKPLAYVITFIEKLDEDERHIEKTDDKQSEKEMKNKLYGRLDGSSSSSGSVLSQRLQSKPRAARQEEKRASVSTLQSATTDSEEQLTLQEYLQKMRPDFYSNAEQRRKCVNDLHNLRYQ